MTNTDQNNQFRKDLDTIPDKLCQTIDGHFDVFIEGHYEDELLQKFCMLTNFLLDSARRSMRTLETT